MGEFDHWVSLLGLLMGLSLVEVVSGAVRTAHSVRDVRIGLLTPLLGLFVMLDLTSYWENAWGFRALIGVNFVSLFVGLFVAAGYYFLAAMVFPADIAREPDFDRHFARIQRTVLPGLVVVNLPIVIITGIARMSPDGGVSTALVMMIYFVPIIIAALARTRAMAFAALVAMVLDYGFWLASALARLLGSPFLASRMPLHNGAWCLAVFLVAWWWGRRHYRASPLLERQSAAA